MQVANQPLDCADDLLFAPDDCLASILGELGYAQDTREQMLRDDERAFLAYADQMALFASILETGK